MPESSGPESTGPESTMPESTGLASGAPESIPASPLEHVGIPAQSVAGGSSTVAQTILPLGSTTRFGAASGQVAGAASVYTQAQVWPTCWGSPAPQSSSTGGVHPGRRRSIVARHPATAAQVEERIAGA